MSSTNSLYTSKRSDDFLLESLPFDNQFYIFLNVCLSSKKTVRPIIERNVHIFNDQHLWLGTPPHMNIRKGQPDEAHSWFQWNHGLKHSSKFNKYDIYSRSLIGCVYAPYFPLSRAVSAPIMNISGSATGCIWKCVVKFFGGKYCRYVLLTCFIFLVLRLLTRRINQRFWQSLI